MPKPTTEKINVPPPGRWIWNDDMNGLEFTCSLNSADDAKEKRKMGPLHEQVKKRLERSAQITSSSSRGRRKTLVSTAFVPMFLSSVKRSQREQVTMEHVKQVALSLLQENEAIPIPLCFLSLMKCRELNAFLAALLLYLSCYFEKMSLERKPKPLMAEPSVTEKQVMAETCAKVDLAQKQLALCYSTLILGLGLSQQHHMSCGRSKVSWTHRDRQLYECLYSFLCYAAWVTFGRKDLKGIQEEVGRLLRSDTFNPTLNGKESERSENQEESKANPKEPSPVTTERKKSERRPALSKIVTQRSPVMVSLLPFPREEAPHLFQRSHPRERSTAKLCNTEELMEQLSEQLASFRFGILGKPLKEFSRTTLMPRWSEHYDDNDDDDDDHDDNSSVHMQAKNPSFMTSRMSIAEEKPGTQSRANTVNSHATTEGQSSVTE
ncbi:protein phosphatase 1 regulatory subunit 36 isoform X1 [Alosa sapidissima]|uniref:protein phosphatase 1 regulatory subunit 36 isoform X1 n=3 Tax=Alosa sapidissima TaxID=34773 RepID=UPI001C093DC7|nr:protein phosphatase 1 regulatory subunit 36 isoform X1 [Alosa sapidissima]